MTKQQAPSGYQLSRKWFDFSFENPELIRPIHTAVYFFAIEQCNRLSWTAKFGMPTSMAMLALGIKHHSTYSKALDDLVEWGFITMIQKSKNQYTANIIALSKNSVATSEALSKAISVAHSEASDGQVQCIKTKKPITKKPITQYRKLCEWFRDRYKNVHPDKSEEINRNYNEEKWCKEIDSLVRLDKHSYEEVSKVLEFIISDSFWSEQVRSLASLRNTGKNGCKKFDNAKSSMTKKISKPTKTGQAKEISRDGYAKDF